MRGYLQEFFGRPAAGFALHSGQRRLPDPQITPELDDTACAELAGVADHVRAGTLDPAHAAALASAHELPARVVNACRTPADEIIATRTTVLAHALDPHNEARAEATLTGALAALAAQGEPDRLPVRAHLFFRTSAGWCACSDPNCRFVEGEFAHPARAVGKIYPTPRIRCDCGARCLDLLCCQTCGELMLGGYSQPAPTTHGGGVYLLPDRPNLEEVPDRTFADQTYDNYKVYWPDPFRPRPTHGQLELAALSVLLHPRRVHPRARAGARRQRRAAARLHVRVTAPAAPAHAGHPRDADPLPELR